MKRGEKFKRLGCVLLTLVVLKTTGCLAAGESQAGQFRIWVWGDAHVSTDSEYGRESLAESIRHSEDGGNYPMPGKPLSSPAFDWDIAIALGDFAGDFGTPTDEEGREIVRQFGVLKKHRREQIYSLAGNHDATTDKETPRQWWFRKWIDPMGENTGFSGVDSSRRPFETYGTWERYSFRVGNLLILMMSDRNDLPPPVGRGKPDPDAKVGGYPAGAVTTRTFDWWRQMVEANPDDIIIAAHHHMLKDTTTASGDWEGFTKNPDGSWRPLYHGYNPRGAPIGSSYLYWLDDQPDAQVFEKFLARAPGSIDFWLGAHTHINPLRETGQKSYLEQKWGVTFINSAAISRFHNPLIVPPSSRLITFTEGSDKAKVQFYLHSRDVYHPGWFDELETVVQLTKPFKMPETR